ncbi:MAG TPA: beta-propeller fold lactonase family protein [Actinomycetes bacterium]|jgi:DNA-binding beta-propeller fold protein YncE|nr:beta-propeller fold lactonase family protein [Actinomycetes bacterium]
MKARRVLAIVAAGVALTAATGSCATLPRPNRVAALGSDTSVPAGGRLPTAKHSLQVRSVPAGARIQLTDVSGTAWDGRTPVKRSLYEGPVTVELTRTGFNPVRREVDLVKNRHLTVWLDPAGLLLTSERRWGTGPSPKQVAYTPDGSQLWVTLLGGHGIQVFDAATGSQLDQIKLGTHGAVEVIFTADGRRAYASQMETASVYEIDTRSYRIRRQIDGKGSWSKVLALSPDERTLYLANWVSDDISEIDLRSGTVRRLIPTVDTPRGLYPTPDGKRLYVAGYGHGEIAVIDLDTYRQKILLRTGGAMRHLVGDSTGKTVYADDMAEAVVYAVDTTTDKVHRLADVDRNPNTIDLSPDGRVLFVSCRGRNGSNYYLPGPEWGSVVLVDTHSGNLLDAIVGGDQTTGLDVSADGTRLAFSDFLGDMVRTYAIPDYDALASGQGGRVEAHYADLKK